MKANDRSAQLRRDLRAIVGDGVAFSVMVGAGEAYIPAFALAAGLGEMEGRVGPSALEIGEQAPGIAGHAHGRDAPAELPAGALDVTRDGVNGCDGVHVFFGAVRERRVVAGEQGDPPQTSPPRPPDIADFARVLRAGTLDATAAASHPAAIP